MIDDSVPWRAELLKVAARLERKTKQRRWSERTGFLIERDVMTSAYAIRRLMEASKVSQDTSGMGIIVNEFPALGARPDFLNRYKLDSLYDFAAEKNAQLGLRSYCNQLIHSYVWVTSVDEENQFNGIFAASEKECIRRLFFFSAENLINTCRKVGEEEITAGYMRRDENGAAYWVSLSQKEVDEGKWPFPWHEPVALIHGATATTPTDPETEPSD